jgi:uncharacterized membrane protein YbhN (UPF0104 family)
VAAALFVVVAIGAAGYAIYHERSSFADALRSIGAGSIAASFVLGLVGVAATYPLWREVLAGLGVAMPWMTGARVFFVSQLGKYVPGSVWPVLMQMEAGKQRGASRRTMLAANIIALSLSCTIGLLIACALLPVYNGHVLAHYWWALLALPVLVALLHPRVLPGLLDRAFALIHRPPLHEELDIRATARASCWSVVSWVGLGAQLGILANAVDHRGISTYLLSAGAVALAVPLGVLVIPTPAGAGVRDVVLVLVLTASMTSGQALAVVVASRVLLILSDLALAGVAALTRRWATDRETVPPEGSAAPARSGTPNRGGAVAPPDASVAGAPRAHDPR